MGVVRKYTEVGGPRMSGEAVSCGPSSCLRFFLGGFAPKPPGWGRKYRILIGIDIKVLDFWMRSRYALLLSVSLRSALDRRLAPIEYMGVGGAYVFFLMGGNRRLAPIEYSRGVTGGQIG